MSQELNGFLSNESNLSGSITNGANLIGSFIQGGGGGTSDYNDLDNKPKINNVTLSGNKTSHDLGLMPETTLAAVATSGDYDDLIDKPVLSEVATTGDYDDLINKPVIPDMTDYYNKTETDSLLDGKVDDSQINTNVYQSSGSGYKTVAFIRATNKPEIRAMRIGPYYTQEAIQAYLSEKANTADLAAVATSGDYDDLLNKPELATVATSGDYDDLLNKPSIPSLDVTDISNSFTITKTSGNWSVDSISAYRSGKTVQIVITMTGNGSSVSAGSNGFVGTITNGPLPVIIVRLVGYYNNCPVMMQIEPDGTVTGRALAVNVTVTSTGQLPLSATYITNN